MKHDSNDTSMLALFCNAIMCNKACRFLENYSNGKHAYVWIEKPNGETIMLKKDWRIKTAEILPIEIIE